MANCRIAQHLRRNWGHLHKAGLGICTFSQDILFPRLQEFTLEAWLAYSTPAPSNTSQLLSCFLTCCGIAVLIAILFYHWLFSSLQYSFQFSVTTATVISFLALLTLFLVHPLRCMFTMIVPTLGTKQGRRLLLSACFMIMAVNIVPNIMSNIKAILQVIKCICKTSSESLLTSTALLGNATWDFSHNLKNVIDTMPDKIGKPRDGHVKFDTHSNNFVLGQKMINASLGIKEDFLYIEDLAQKIMLLANRVIAGFFLFYIIFESAWYLKCYLTDLRFDNIYITKKLEDLAQEKKATHLLVCTPKKLIKSTGLKLSREELMTCLTQIFLLTLVLVLMLVIIATDYIVFYLAQAAVTEVSQFPVVPIILLIKYEATLKFLTFLPQIFNNAFSIEGSLFLFEKSYHRNISLVSAECSMKWPSPPNKAVVLAVGLLYCIIYAMVFLETYSHRFCRKISASFFESQEDQRVRYLYRKLVRKHKKKENWQQQQESKASC
ncbi:osteoclast stimulatory transmembrane protein [Tiliqua scincoides]|uniref:osteoclast stimulatory transmembrane protein n=1 Tax=Tiliqua scincoides TaxID=71010 RepID=UPI0034632A4F